MLKSVAVGTLLALLALAPNTALAQPSDLLLPSQASTTRPQGVAMGRRSRPVRVSLPALARESIKLDLFDDVVVTVDRVLVDQPGPDRLVWVGKDEFGAQAVITVAAGVLTGTVHMPFGIFEITRDPGGDYRVVEIDPAAFPTEDPDDAAAGLDLVSEVVTDPVANTPTGEFSLTGTPTDIAVMIVWTPRSETAGGGRAAMDSLALNLVANANQVYVNSGVNVRLTLAYAGPISFTETTSASTDVASLRSPTDGKADGIHALRDTYAADIVTMLGEYSGTGSCGYGYIMTPLSSSFASSAFNVVDRGCSLGNLSYAHEVGHNQGMLHNRADAGGLTPSQPYAYGYQDPSGAFRTVLSYGSMVRIPYLSSPLTTYGGRPTGTSTEDNARTLSLNAATVAAFRGGSTTTTPTTSPSCTYALSATSLTFPVGGGSKSVSVTAPSGCAWTATESSGWVSLNTTGGTGSGTVVVTTTANGNGSTRKTTVKIAGLNVSVRQRY
ncbi:hypothetical protein TBR22_A17660 [Luteitalea sp. TBR-22]|uniref:reprolysin-like metallopeptidase n=1 Tax=Luteitalea sp. TBR-22 TaxID=2802971 RepID=UPI001AF679C6|nr:zinc-dependent metalloprotease family protein [Luteitalea sp. TBR-22]BCS32552.1 hypothetical protein TBR22_A17660 [Luteitalea sp. TBR-22]